MSVRERVLRVVLWLVESDVGARVFKFEWHQQKFVKRVEDALVQARLNEKYHEPAATGAK